MIVGKLATLFREHHSLEYETESNPGVKGRYAVKGICGLPQALLVAVLSPPRQSNDTAAPRQELIIKHVRPWQGNWDFVPGCDKPTPDLSAGALVKSYHDEICNKRRRLESSLSKANPIQRRKISKDSFDNLELELPDLRGWTASVAVLSRSGQTKAPCAVCQCSISLEEQLHSSYQASSEYLEAAMQGPVFSGLCVEGQFLMAVAALDLDGSRGQGREGEGAAV